ncbi:urease accessory protein UreD [Streptomyces albidoflavus]|uniref:urease accessory protein UreD n=1 Tax=Streptomyces albidoflavus TaxID=1886 RepID=UPI00101E5831|nr:urease accessory protein UreD [Streptomyces albidoflavus]RZD82431.1 urease accessory protein [Streptomyces albidoflavus]
MTGTDPTGEETRPTLVEAVRDAAGRQVAAELSPGAFLAPRPLFSPPDRVRVALVSTRAGLLAGDTLDLRITVGAGARLELVEPSGLVAYDHRGGASRWQARVEIAEGGELLWSGAPFVIASGARVERLTEVEVAAGGRMLWRDLLVLGRSGERGGAVRALTRARHEGAELLVEDLDLLDPEQRELPGVLGPHRVIGSVTSLGVRPPGAGHPSRMELAGPGAQVRLLDRVTPPVEAGLAAVWESWTATECRPQPPSGSAAVRSTSTSCPAKPS